MTPEIDLVIFDCDGVLVDSEIISCRAHAEVLTRHGYPITSEQVFDRFLGRSALQAMLEIEAELGRSLPDDFDAQLDGRIVQLLREPRWRRCLISKKRSTRSRGRSAWPRAVRRERIRVSLGHVGLYDRLAPNIFSATQVRNGKPAPDLFLFAAAQMGTPPDRCLVIEDSLSGIKGARAAGMTVFGYHGASHCRAGYHHTLRAAGAAETFDDMRQLPGLIGRD